MIKKKFLIIGSNSFSGSHFINFLLKKNLKVIGVSRSIENSERFLSYKKNKKLKNFSFYQIDLNKSEHVKKLIYIWQTLEFTIKTSKCLKRPAIRYQTSKLV